MPKRSNEFQQIVFLLERQLADSAVVTESRLLPRLDGSGPAEVDITVEQDVGGHHIIIGIECTARARTPDIGWVEKMIGKHENLPTDKCVLVSKNGFTEGAISRALSAGYPTLSIEEAKSTNWANYLGQLPLGDLLVARYELQVKGGEIDLKEKGKGRIELDAETVLRRKDSKDEVSLKEYSLNILKDERVKREVMQDWLTKPLDERPSSFGFSITHRPDPPLLLQLEEEGELEIESIRVDAVARVRSSPLTLVAGSYQESAVVYGSAEDPFSDSDLDAKLRVILVEREGQEPEGAMIIPEHEGEKDAVFPIKWTSDDEKDTSPSSHSSQMSNEKQGSENDHEDPQETERQ